MLRIPPDDIAHFIATIDFAIYPILLITLWVIYFENSLLKIVFIVIVLFLISIKYALNLTENGCVTGGPHTWIKVGEHEVVEPWSDKQHIIYLVADFKCSVCGMKKEKVVER